MLIKSSVLKSKTIPFKRSSFVINGFNEHVKRFLMFDNKTPLTDISSTGRAVARKVDIIFKKILYPVVLLNKSIKNGNGFVDVLKDRFVFVSSNSGNLSNIVSAALTIASASSFVFLMSAIS